MKLDSRSKITCENRAFRVEKISKKSEIGFAEQDNLRKHSFQSKQISENPEIGFTEQNNLQKHSLYLISDFKLEIEIFKKWNLEIGKMQVCLFFIRGISEPPG